jgi:hypothetical protein
MLLRAWVANHFYFPSIEITFMRSLRKVLFGFSILMVAVATTLLGWANWPVARTTQTAHLHLIAPASWDAADIQIINEILFNNTLTLPKSIKTGQTGHYQIVLEGLPGSFVATGVTWQLHIRSELILPGFHNQQEGMLSQAVQYEKPLRFDWDVKANADRRSTGVLRIFVDYLSPAGEIESQLLSVTDLELTSISLIGLSTTNVTSLAVALLLLAGLAGALGSSRTRA